MWTGGRCYQHDSPALTELLLGLTSSLTTQLTSADKLQAKYQAKQEISINIKYRRQLVKFKKIPANTQTVMIKGNIYLVKIVFGDNVLISTLN